MATANICKQKECKLYDPDYPNNCRIMKEITRCRMLEKMGIFKTGKRSIVTKHTKTGWVEA